MSLRRASRVTLLVTTLLFLSAVEASAATVDRDVPYAVNPHPEQHLDIHWPDGTPSATVVFIHGGSLSESGERRDSPIYVKVCDPFVKAGWVCATVDYRLSPSFQWPVMVEDVAAAIAKVRELVAERKLDPDQLFLFGHSSGCHLAGVLGTNPIYLATQELSPSNLAGQILMGCTLDREDAAVRRFTVEKLRVPFEDQPSEKKMYGTPENWLNANPASHLGPHVPPTLVLLARQERFFPSILEQGARFVRRLLESDVPADLVIVPGRHSSSIEQFGMNGDQSFEAVRRFLEAPAATGEAP